MPTGGKVVHGLDGQQNGKLEGRFRVRFGEAQVKISAALDHLRQDLIDQVLIGSRPPRHGAPDVFAPPRQERGGRHIIREFRSVREESTEVAIIEGRIVYLITLAFLPVVRSQRLAQARQGIHLPAGCHRRFPRIDVPHEPVRVLQFRQGAPPGVPFSPHGVGAQPNREGLRKILVRMALCVPGVEMDHVAPTVGSGSVVLGIRLGRLSEESDASSSEPESVGIVDGVPHLVSQDAKTRFGSAALYFQHLRPLELGEARMGQVKWNGDSRDAVWSEPVVGKPKVRSKMDAARPGLPAPLFDPLFKNRSPDAHAKIAHANPEEIFLAQVLPMRRAGLARSRPAHAALHDPSFLDRWLIVCSLAWPVSRPLSLPRGPTPAASRFRAPVSPRPPPRRGAPPPRLLASGLGFAAPCAPAEGSSIIAAGPHPLGFSLRDSASPRPALRLRAPLSLPRGPTPTASRFGTRLRLALRSS